MDQLNLFGENVIKVTKKEEEVKQKEKANVKNTSKAAKGDKGDKKATTPSKKKQEIKLFSDWTIHYYGNTFTVTEFVQDIPEGGITTEELRAAMAQEFFEMTKERTHFDHDSENKRLFPKVTGGAKG
ncbi:hypothetical protein BKP35_12110 [Anaerobacillus arseniciselenatis]|uniref:Uncharacterized protein n=1 Tax=Anaerobacillus arseniciselenatis TaxID=85682 RepID=A0A1S2LGZ0_9BACI|nr:hypothetical protein [Anaerobacillus arseniciselenatis]OIJ11480.1 hypothetical protein BKP35_12110 [Anaerobacillus arseniciselenatis]